MKRNYFCLKKNKYFYKEYSLKTIQNESIEDIRKWRNKKINILRQSKEITKKQQINYFKKNIWPDMNKKFPKNILFTFNINNKLIGYGGLVHISWTNKRSEVSFLLNNDFSDTSKEYKKYFQYFLIILKKIIFDELKFKKIYSETFVFRKYHIKVIESLGFKKEGKLLAQYYFKGKFIDTLLHCYLN